MTSRHRFQMSIPDTAPNQEMINFLKNADQEMKRTLLRAGYMMLVASQETLAQANPLDPSMALIAGRYNSMMNYPPQYQNHNMMPNPMMSQQMPQQMPMQTQMYSAPQQNQQVQNTPPVLTEQVAPQTPVSSQEEVKPSEAFKKPEGKKVGALTIPSASPKPSSDNSVSGFTDHGNSPSIESKPKPQVKVEKSVELMDDLEDPLALLGSLS